MKQQQCGRIDEAGTIHSLKKQGFNFYKCIMELIANTIDVDANNIKFIVNMDYIYILDNGNGMKIDSLIEMFAMNKSNHASEKSLGISGVGGKIATFILSGKKEVTIYTHYKHKDYLRAIVPWDTMVSQEKYTDMININIMTQDEINYFKSKLNTGTIIKFPYSDELNEKIKDNLIN